MRKITLSLATLAALVWLGMDSSTAQAAHGYRGFGLHIGGRNVHFDVGNPHGYRSYGSRHTSYRARSRGYWHNTSHLDYHPTEHVWHGNHIDIVPGHYDVHHSGHWDRRSRGHRR